MTQIDIDLLRILLVEDNEHDRLAFRRSFKRNAGYRYDVTECVRAEEALAELERGGDRFDLIVIDHDLPGMSGLTLCALLLERGIELPMVLLTGRGSEQLAVVAIKAGVDDYIVKDASEGYLDLLPFVLADVVKKRLERKARERAEDALRESRARLAQIVEGSPVPTFVIDHRHRVTHWNRACEKIIGVPAAEIIGTTRQWQAFYHGERPILADLIVSGASEDEVARLYGGKYRKSALIDDAYEAEDYFANFPAGPRWLFFTAAPIRDQDGRLLGAIETLQDITERRRAERRLAASEQRLAQIVGGVSVPTFVIDENHVVTHWNRACEKIIGVPACEIIGTSGQWRGFYPSERPVLADMVAAGALECDVAEVYAGKYRKSPWLEGAFEAEDYFPNFPSGPKWLYFTAAPLRDESGNIVGAVETLQDITERMRVQEALKASEADYRRLSITDGLTQLFNSRCFHERLRQEIERAERYGQPLSLVLIDVDHFKAYNDTYGHLEGDRVLAGVAKAIHGCLRSIDSAYRYGGEEFAVLLPTTDLVQAVQAAERLRQAIAQLRFQPTHGAPVGVTASFGVAEYAGGEARAFVRSADQHLYAAKSGGRNRVASAGG